MSNGKMVLWATICCLLVRAVETCQLGKKLYSTSLGDNSFWAYSFPDSALNMRKRKTWVLYFSLIPLAGSRIAFPLDKQLEIAHAETY